MSILQTFWTEKYRPKCLDDIILPEKDKDNIRQSIKSGRIPHYLFIGPPGTGKTSLAKVIINELGAEALVINASEERGIDVIRDKVMRFIQVATDKPKIVFLDEADSLTGEAQASLRNVMETYSDYCRFILTGNYDKFISPIKDRCEVIRFKQLSKEDCLFVLRKIVVNESIELETGDELDRIIDAFYPSIRQMISNLQKYSIPIRDNSGNIVGYKLELPSNLNKEDELDYDTIFSMVNDVSIPVNKIREQLYELGVTDFTPLYRYFFKKYVENKDELSAITVTEYMYRDTFVADKELNFVGMILALRNKAYPFMIANIVQQVISNNTNVSQSNTTGNFKPELDSKVEEQQVQHFNNVVNEQQEQTLHSFPQSTLPPFMKKKNSKFTITNNTQPPTVEQKQQFKHLTKNTVLSNLNKILKSGNNSTVITNNSSNNDKVSDFTSTIDDIYSSIQDE